jgi:hypothetical protein
MPKRNTKRIYKKASPRFRRVTYTTAPDELFDKLMYEIMERNAVMLSRLAK